MVENECFSFSIRHSALLHPGMHGLNLYASPRIFQVHLSQPLSTKNFPKSVKSISIGRSWRS